MTEFLNPEKVLKQLKLREDMIAADFGCGSGGWVLPLARKLDGGKVYAIDILEEPLSALRAKAKIAKIENVETIKLDVEKGTSLLEGSCDLVLMTNLLFEVEDKKKVLEEGKRILKKGGRILVVDWKKEAALGPKEGKVSPEEIKEIATEIGLKIEKPASYRPARSGTGAGEFEASPYHYGLILLK